MPANDNSTHDGVDGIDFSEFAKLDLEALFNIREWVRAAVEGRGAKIVGAGIGIGGDHGIADVQFELEGHPFNLQITPLR